jgi:hypothetical protein
MTNQRSEDAKFWDSLKIGSIISHKISRGVYIVTGHYGDRATAVKTVDISNPDEWEIVGENNKKEPRSLGA